MIEYLHIKDLAIIDELEVDFGKGLNVITGETGAGKSIMIAGFSLLRGAKATSQMVRSGADFAVVEAVLRPNPTPTVAALMEELGIPNGEELIVSRRISAKGRGRVRINGELSSVAVLERLIAALVDLTGQHDQQSLAISANHRSIVDDFGVPEEHLERVRNSYIHVKEISRELDSLPVNPGERRTREEILIHQLKELEAAGFNIGEEDELEAERKRLASAADLEAVSREAVQVLYEDTDSVTDKLARMGRSLSKWGDIETLLGDVAARLDEARVLSEDAALELRGYTDDLESDPQKLEQLEERLLFLAGLKRKHGCATLEELKKRMEEMSDELDSLSEHDKRVEELLAALSKVRDELSHACKGLSRARKSAAKRLEKEVEKELAQLGMKGIRFKIEVTERSAGNEEDSRLVHKGRVMGPKGWDCVEMMVSANPGEPLQPVRQIASGGELSRLLLAVKTVTAAKDMVTSYIFDEVDAGIGGPIADVVGAKLARLAEHRQVICVTHLPQIAAYAGEHFVVIKETTGGRTTSRIRKMEGRERTESLGRMMSGTDKLSKNALKHADELLKRADVFRKSGDNKAARN